MKETFAVLNQMVADGAIENYAVAGAIGAMFYVEPFSTQDIDVFVLTPDWLGSQSSGRNFHSDANRRQRFVLRDQVMFIC